MICFSDDCQEKTVSGYLYCRKCLIEGAISVRSNSKEHFQKAWDNLHRDIDYYEIERELSQLVRALNEGPDIWEKDYIIENIERAIWDARCSNGPSLLLKLSKVGTAEVVLASKLEAKFTIEAIKAVTPNLLKESNSN